DENIVLNLSRMNRILDWDPENGRISVEPGVTLKQLWEYVLEDGWWPPVATGTMHVTIGGMAAVNAHGKNAWKVGGIGDHIYEFDLLLPTGEILTCNREQNSDIFHAAIGGVGMLGCFTSLTLHLKRIYSGLIHVEGSTKPNLSQTLHWFENHLHNSDYLVGWLDAFATGNKLGRSELHRANHLRQDEDPIPHQTMRIPNQQLGENIMGFVPRSILWMFQRPFWNHYGMRYVNSVKFQLAQFRGHHQFQQPHALYHFLLDNFNWRKPFGPGGLIQYQPFVPIENAEEALHKLLVVCQRHRMQNFLSVIKRHKPDPFLLSYQPDGFSMAMDFQITNRNREKVVRLVREMDEIVLAANGRFYFAKDSTVRPQIAQHYLGSKAIDQFKTIKHRCDPNGILESNLWRRVFVS
ncbi:MAG: FAD-binding oxidoreductase, partial [Chloroflexota bacterium]